MDYLGGRIAGQAPPGFAVYASHNKIKTMLRTLIKWITAAYFKMEAGPRQRIVAILIKIKSVVAQIAIKLMDDHNITGPRALTAASA